MNDERPAPDTTDNGDNADNADNADDHDEPDPDARMYSTVPLECEDGSTVVIRQQNVGPGNELGGGEFPDPDTPPQPPAPGSA